MADFLDDLALLIPYRPKIFSWNGALQERNWRSIPRRDS